MSTGSKDGFGFVDQTLTPPPSRQREEPMRNRETTVRQAVNRMLQYATIAAATMTLVACSSYEKRGGRDTTGTTPGGTSLPEGSLPMCNAPDNRAPPNQEDSACTAADNSQNTIVIKVATEDDPSREVENGQTFFCLCGDARLAPTPRRTITGTLDEFHSFAIVSLNPTCLVSETIGGTTYCTVPGP
jgi:hypothetical protein